MDNYTINNDKCDELEELEDANGIRIHRSRPYLTQVAVIMVRSRKASPLSDM
jgi:hypothetical protein